MAAGKGARMLPLTETTPKPLLKISGKPILERIIREMPDEVSEVIIVVGYLKEQVIDFIKEAFPDLDVKFVVEEGMRGSAYAVYACKDLMHGRFLVLNADDLYRKEDLQKMVRQDLAMLCMRMPTTEEYSRFNRFLVDKDMNYQGIVSYQHSEWTNMGVYALTTEFFNVPLVRIKSGEFGLPQTVASMATDYGKKVKIVEGTFWVPVGHPPDIQKAEAMLEKAGGQ